MKLLYSPFSPFARKVRVVAHECGASSRITVVPVSVQPTERNEEVSALNPLAQVPTLVLDDGSAIYDSRVICEMLDAEGNGGLFPGVGPQRWRALTEQALGDGLMGAALLARYETALRPEGERSDAWRRGQMNKVEAALDRLEALSLDFGGRVDIGTVTLGCALGYLDFRFAELGWRARRPAAERWYGRLSERASFRDTRPDAG